MTNAISNKGFLTGCLALFVAVLGGATAGWVGWRVAKLAFVVGLLALTLGPGFVLKIHQAIISVRQTAHLVKSSPQP